MRAVAAALLAAVLLSAAPAASAGAATASFEFPALNREHRDVEVAPPPLVVGPGTIRLTPRDARVELLANRLELTPGDGPGYAGALAVEFQGAGRLAVQVDFGGPPAALEDSVVLPRQRHRIEGRMAVVRMESGFIFEILERPDHFTVRAQSGLGAALAELCGWMNLAAFGALDCSGVSEAFSHVRVPLPEAGTAFFLTDDELGGDAAGLLAAYLAARPLPPAH